MTTWRKLIERELEAQGESWKDEEATTLDLNGFERPFDAGYGAEEGEPFTLWTKNRVYFPVCYDGAESVASVSRNPDGQPTKHIGG